MAGTANRFKFPTLSLLHNPGGQLEEGLMAPDQAHNALYAIAHACPLQHACNCVPCLFLYLRQCCNCFSQGPDPFSRAAYATKAAQTKHGFVKPCCMLQCCDTVRLAQSVHGRWHNEHMSQASHICDSCNHVSCAGTASSFPIVPLSFPQAHMNIIYCALAADEPLKVLFDLQHANSRLRQSRSCGYKGAVLRCPKLTIR